VKRIQILQKINDGWTDERITEMLDVGLSTVEWYIQKKKTLCLIQCMSLKHLEQSLHLLRESFLPLHNMIMHGQAASFD
jgi:hypothetical protein